MPALEMSKSAQAAPGVVSDLSGAKQSFGREAISRTFVRYFLRVSPARAESRICLERHGRWMSLRRLLDDLPDTSLSAADGWLITRRTLLVR